MLAIIIITLASALVVSDALDLKTLSERQTCEIAPVKLSSSEISDMVSAHNNYRKSDKANMEAQTWEDDLAKRAQAWTDYLASVGKFDHGYLNLCTTGEEVGQNLWYYSASSRDMLPKLTEAVKSWYSEKADYNYDTNTCSATCGHYTQIVWEASTKVGCGATYYQQDKMSSVIVACDYYPPGNWDGEQPY